MNKFNRKFNSRLKNLERWFLIVRKLSEFEGIVNDFDGANPLEIRTLKAIHRKLYDCSVMANEHLREVQSCITR